MKGEAIIANRNKYIPTEAKKWGPNMTRCRYDWYYTEWEEYFHPWGSCSWRFDESHWSLFPVFSATFDPRIEARDCCYFLDLSWNSTSANWQWGDGTQLTPAFTDLWAAGEPNTFDRSPILRKSDKNFYGRRTNQNDFICERSTWIDTLHWNYKCSAISETCFDEMVFVCIA